MTDGRDGGDRGEDRKLAGDGRFELFKSSKIFDGPVHRKQHGFATEPAA